MKEQETINPNLYPPLIIEEVAFIPELDMPERQFAEDEYSKWVRSVTKAGVIIINMIHRDHSDAVCQVQLFPGKDGAIKIFFQRLSPSENHIPNDVTDAMFFKEALPGILESFEQNPYSN